MKNPKLGPPKRTAEQEAAAAEKKRLYLEKLEKEKVEKALAEERKKEEKAAKLKAAEEKAKEKEANLDKQEQPITKEQKYKVTLVSSGYGDGIANRNKKPRNFDRRFKKTMLTTIKEETAEDISGFETRSGSPNDITSSPPSPSNNLDRKMLDGKNPNTIEHADSITKSPVASNLKKADLGQVK